MGRRIWGIADFFLVNAMCDKQTDEKAGKREYSCSNVIIGN
jgi:hypothetical protein